MATNKGKLINKVIIVIYLIGYIAIGFYTFITKEGRFYLTFTMPLFLFIPLILEKIFKLNRNYFLNNLMYVFFFFAYCIGVIAGAFSHSQIYDKIVHMFSGILFTYIGAYVYSLISKKSLDSNSVSAKNERVVFICFSVFFALSCEYAWEIFEYFQSLITGEDPQWVALTGVGDTMQDMISCLIGAALTACYFICRFKKWDKKRQKEDSEQPVQLGNP